MSSFIEMHKFVAPEYVFGVGARKLAGGSAKNLGARRVLLVTDPGVIAAGWANEVITDLKDNGLDYIVFDGVSPNPRDHEVMAGAKVYQETGCNAIIAVGGGSPIDCAKGIGIVSTHQRDILEFEGVDQVEVPMPPLICIPTTGGTSADVSQFAIISDTARKVKIAIVSKAVVPDLALIDPETLTTMDAELTAFTGLDALTHAIEAYVSNAASPMTDIHALEAIRLLTANLQPSFENLDDIDLRAHVMLASLQAGLAFSNAILGAVHAMAHSLGGMLDLPHGECNAILLDHVMEFNLPTCPKRFARIAAAMGLDADGLGNDERAEVLLEKVRKIKHSVGITRTLNDLNVREEDIPQLSSFAAHDPCILTNPRSAGEDDLKTIYEKAF